MSENRHEIKRRISEALWRSTNSVPLTGLQHAHLLKTVLEAIWPEHEYWCDVFSHLSHSDDRCTCGKEVARGETRDA